MLNVARIRIMKTRRFDVCITQITSNEHKCLDRERLGGLAISRLSVHVLGFDFYNCRPRSISKT